MPNTEQRTFGIDEKTREERAMFRLEEIQSRRDVSQVAVVAEVLSVIAEYLINGGTQEVIVEGDNG